MLTNFLAYKLEPKDLELRFRSSILLEEKTQSRIICYLMLIFFIGMGILEYFYFGFSKSLLISIASRSTTIIALLFGIWFSFQQVKVRTYDMVIPLISLMVLIHVLVASSVRPDASFVISISFVWQIIAVFAIYTVLPATVYSQITLGFFLTAGNFIIWFMTKAQIMSPLESTILVSSLLFVNIYGMLMSVQMNRSRRRQFVLYENELKAKKELEITLEEVKILRGIIPICVTCKKIRDSKGYWNQVEAYVEKHSEAQFSHSICEDCADKLYGDEVWYKKLKAKKVLSKKTGSNI